MGGDEWNCNSLGRDSMSPQESQQLRRSGFDHKTLRALEVKYSEYGSILPYVVTCSQTGKLLHYNGAMKPWLMDRFDKNGPSCALPRVLRDNQQSWIWTRSVKVFCEEITFVNCAEIWSSYISETSSCALKDFDKEWHEDESRWIGKKNDDEASAERARREQWKGSETKLPSV